MTYSCREHRSWGKRSLRYGQISSGDHQPAAENWKPESADDVPLELSGPVGVLTESDDLFEAVEPGDGA